MSTFVELFVNASITNTCILSSISIQIDEKSKILAITHNVVIG